jgi:hypothetical protein
VHAHLVHVYQQKRLRDGWFVVQSRASFAVSARANLCAFIQVTTEFVIVNGVSESTFAPRRQKRDSKKKKKNNERSRRRARRKEREATTHPKKSAEGRSGEIFPRTDALLEGRRRRNRSSRLAQHLEVKRTVHAILLRPEDGRQVFRHRKQSVCSFSLSYSF